MIDREFLAQQIEELQKEKQNLLDNLNQVEGALRMCRFMLNKLEQEQEPEPEEGP